MPPEASYDQTQPSSDLTPTIAAVKEAWVASGSAPPKNFLRTYFAHLDPGDAKRLGSAGLLGVATSHLDWARSRTSDVRVYNPDGEGYSSPRTVVTIVTRNRPYVTGSVVSELTWAGYAIRMVLHPIMAVQRNEDLAFLDLGDEASLEVSGGDTSSLPLVPELGDAVVESWIHVEIDRVPDDELAGIEDALRESLKQVTASDHDAEAMRARAEAIADELDAGSAGDDLAGEAAQASRLLRWLGDHFTFLGYKEYSLHAGPEGDYLQPVTDSALGIMTLRQESGTNRHTLTNEVERRARQRHVLVLTKANSRSRVRRHAYMDYIGVKKFDADGNVVGERRFIGLFTTRAYTASPTEIPLIDDKVAEIVRRAGFSRRSHSGEDLADILESYPRDELFQASVDEVFPTVMAAVNMEERHESRVFVRRDPYLRFVSVIVYVPKELYDTASRRRVEGVLRTLYEADSVDFDVYLSDSALARLHFVARVPRGVELPDVPADKAESRIVAALRSWTEDVHAFLAPPQEIVGSEEILRANRWTDAFPLGYKEFHTPAEAVEDIARLEQLLANPEAPLVKLYERRGTTAPVAGQMRMSFYRTEPISLSTILPMLSNLGAEVLDENPFVIEPGGGEALYIYDFGLQFGRAIGPEDAERLREAFIAVWTGATESGVLDGLVIEAGLSWRDVALIRAISRYLRQVGFAYSDRFVADTLVAHSEIAALIVALFRAKFDPAAEDGRQERVESIRGEALTKLDDVLSLDADRALRSQIQVIDATVRTNFFRTDEAGDPLARIVLKIHPRELDFAPKPRPALEMWVYSPRVEGVHLRFGPVARGGLRWSDRREDFRTEVLGLVKAQMVKNALIVPTGAKGGFFAKRLPDPSDREAWLAEGKAAYTEFINALLDVTDNIVYVDGARTTEYPDDVVRHDGEDSYLVVAADKGTAAFSDLANSIAMGRGFWLQDAFASGGSVGYDHKAMAITSRGAWESVKRHFRELDVNVDTDEFTVVGIGDMSGDVFGNGMLRSRRIRLVAAFDHRHIFLDPRPDAESSYAERERMFALPRSSWADYDTSLISAGGGVFPRTAKVIDLSAEAAEALGVEPGPRAPQELLSEILRAPVDLLYNGGIGTYIKASIESVTDVGDKANDAIRIDGADVRARVIGEGGNLGLTQLGRIEAALAGVRLNTDAVDNSAGVDSSDHEVNIKLFLATLMTDGSLDPADRDDLLLSMTDEVGDDVLANNYHQNQVLGEAREQTLPMTGTYQRLMRYLERHAELDRAVEFLPSAKDLAVRRESDQGFTSPELSVLLAYVKMHTADALLESTVPDEQWAQSALQAYFPASLMERYGEAVERHPLRREIVTAVLVNTLVDRGGLTYAYRMQEETGASLPQIVRVFFAVMKVFHLEEFMVKVEQLDNTVTTSTQIALQLAFVRLLDRASRWLVHQAPDELDVQEAIRRYGSVVDALYPQVPSLLRGEEEAERTEHLTELTGRGVPEDLAGRAAAMLAEFSLLDVAQAAERAQEAPEVVAAVYYAVSDRFKAPKILDLIGGLDRSDRWSALARGALREDFYLEMFNIVLAVLDSTDPEQDADARIDAWLEENRAGFEQAVETLKDVLDADHNDISVVSVLLRRLRSVLRASSSRSSSGDVNPLVSTAVQGEEGSR